MVETVEICIINHGGARMHILENELYSQFLNYGGSNPTELTQIVALRDDGVLGHPTLPHTQDCLALRRCHCRSCAIKHMRTHLFLPEKGYPWIKNKCANTAEPVQPAKSVIITGWTTYNSWLAFWSIKGFYWPKSETKTMYKKSESDVSVCYTINSADIRRSCRWHTIPVWCTNDNFSLHLPCWWCSTPKYWIQTFCTSFSSLFLVNKILRRL